jgi:large subunit ribosomal protein L10
VEKSKKYQVVENLNQLFKQSGSVIVTHYRGLTVSDITELRTNLKQNDAKFQVTKNTLAKLASKDTDVSQVEHLFNGPVGLAFSEDPVAAAKGIVEFSEKNENLIVLGGVVNGEFLDEQQVQQLAKLPSMDELRAKIIGVIEAPATKLARVAQAPASQIARVLQAYADKA